MLYPVSKETVTAKEALKINLSKIKSIKLNKGSIGNGFAKLTVEYVRPILKNIDRPSSCK